MPTKCPFYGVRPHLSDRYLTLQLGNQCGLEGSYDAPCQIEEDGLGNSWENCYAFNNPQKRQEVMKKVSRVLVITTDLRNPISFEE